MDARLALLLVTALSAQANQILETGAFTKYPPRPLLGGCLSSNCDPPADKKVDESDLKTVTCNVVKGIDLPGNDIKTLTAETPCSCSFMCENVKGCLTWTYDSRTQHCALKSKSFEGSPQVKCSTCMAHSDAGTYYFTCTKTATPITRTKTSFSMSREEAEGQMSESRSASEQHESGTSSSTEHTVYETAETAQTAQQERGELASYEKLSRSVEGGRYGEGTGVKHAVGSETCRISEGFNQPEEFNLMDEPLILASSFLCCDSCARNSLCKSWVWIQDGFECWLKKDYKPELNTIPCKSCVAYSASGEVYVSDATAVRTTSAKGGFESTERGMAKTETLNDDRTETSPMVLTRYETVRYETVKSFVPQTAVKEGQEVGTWEVWDLYRGCDLPGHDLLDKPISAENDSACVTACRETPDCVGYVWNNQTFACHLKKEYVREDIVECTECSTWFKRVKEEPDAPVFPPAEAPQPELSETEPPLTSPSEAQPQLTNNPAQFDTSQSS